jgi:hypothetical protein
MYYHQYTAPYLLFIFLAALAPLNDGVDNEQEDGGMSRAAHALAVLQLRGFGPLAAPTPLPRAGPRRGRGRGSRHR